MTENSVSTMYGRRIEYPAQKRKNEGRAVWMLRTGGEVSPDYILVQIPDLKTRYNPS